MEIILAILMGSLIGVFFVLGFAIGANAKKLGIINDSITHDLYPGLQENKPTKSFDTTTHDHIIPDFLPDLPRGGKVMKIPSPAEIRKKKEQEAIDGFWNERTKRGSNSGSIDMREVGVTTW